jgi:hypothetical protein
VTIGGSIALIGAILRFAVAWNLRTWTRKASA